jgi:hypothetical protein
MNTLFFETICLKFRFNNMIKLLQSTSTQQVSFIPRSMDAYSITLRNESTQEETVITTDFYNNDYYLTVITVFDLVENHYYNFTVKNQAGDVIYIDKIFCTNQTNYSINNGAYVTAAPNDTIFYE